MRVIVLPDLGDVLQRWDYENGDWRDVYQDRKLITYPFDYEALRPGRYRLRGA